MPPAVLKIRRRLLHLETLAKSLLVTFLSGSALTLHDLLTRAENIDTLFTHSGLVHLAHNGLYGGSLALIGLFVKSPLRPNADRS
jgi:hypothetical protein